MGDIYSFCGTIFGPSIFNFPSISDETGRCNPYSAALNLEAIKPPFQSETIVTFFNQTENRKDACLRKRAMTRKYSYKLLTSIPP